MKEKLDLLKRKSTSVMGVARLVLFMVLMNVFHFHAQAVDPLIAQQQNIIRGKVTDEQKRPLPGVTITIVGTTRGVITDNDGSYSIDAKPADKLVFTFIGMESQIIDVDNRTTINVELSEKKEELEEVTVVAFGKQRKESVISSISTVKPAELKIPSTNLTQALAGRVAGVISYQRSGEPGQDNAEFFIRGVTTFGYKTDPLILIDGMESTTTDLARLQVDDIASFSIIKDATGTAVYGARGANGIILITTKEGVEGKAKVDFRFENSVSMPTSNVELADPITYMRMHNEAILTRNPGAPYLPYSYNKIANTELGLDPVLYPVTDWRDALIRDYTMNQRANLSVSGGGKVARYFVSGAFNQDNGLLKVPAVSNFNNNIDLKTYSLRANVNINITNTTELMVRLNGSFDDYTGPLSGGTKVYRDVMRTNPVMFAPYYEPGDTYKYLQHIMFGNYDDGQGNIYLNPYAEMVRGYRDYARSMMLAQLELRQNLAFITEGLNFRSVLNTTRNAFFEISRKYNPFWYQIVDKDLQNPGNYLFNVINPDGGTEYLDYDESSKSVSSVFYSESALTYNRTFNEDHSVSGLLVYIMRNQLDGSAGSLQESLPYRNLGLSGRFTYDYANRYFAEFNFGYNGSERFYKSNRFGFFPAFGLAWSVSNEPFWESIKETISNFRIRATYGLVGNDAIGSSTDRFYYLSEINMNSTDRAASFGLEKNYTRNGIAITRYSNPDISWETSYKTNLALDIGLFGKVDLTTDFFYERRTNIFMSRANIPTTMGLAVTTAANVGEAEGKGVDISLNYSHMFPNRDIWIQGLANFTYAASKYLKYEEPIYPESWMSRVGTPISATWGYLAERLFIDDEEVANSPAQDFGTFRGGDLKFKDLNGDFVINEIDRVPLGFPTTPEINYGFGLSSGYKNVDFSVFFQGSARSSFWISTSATAPFNRYVYSGETVPSNVILVNQLLKAYADSYWSEDNQDIYALWPRLSTSSIMTGTTTNSWFMRDGSFLRLKQMEIGYTPKSLTSRLNLANIRVYVNGSNLLLFSRFKLWDVEMAGNGLGYPIQRVFNLGIQITLH